MNKMKRGASRTGREQKQENEEAVINTAYGIHLITPEEKDWGSKCLFSLQSTLLYSRLSKTILSISLITCFPGQITFIYQGQPLPGFCDELPETCSVTVRQCIIFESSQSRLSQTSLVQVLSLLLLLQCDLEIVLHCLMRVSRRKQV